MTGHRVLIGVAAIVALVASAGFAASSAITTFFYPAAPPMPANVSEPTAVVLARLDSLLRANAPRVLAHLRPGITPEQIARLERENGVRLPDDIKAIYQWHDGSRPASTDASDIIPAHRFLSLEEALAERATLRRQVAATSLMRRLASRLFAGHTAPWISLFSDGAGDGYSYDPTRTAAEGAVFDHFTETRSYLFFPSAKNVMAAVAKCYAQRIFPDSAGEPPADLGDRLARAYRVSKEFGVGVNE